MPDGDLAAGIGTGGYILESFKPAVRATAKRNPNYFKSDARAHFGSIELINFSDIADSLDSQIANGSVDG